MRKLDYEFIDSDSVRISADNHKTGVAVNIGWMDDAGYSSQMRHDLLCDVSQMVHCQLVLCDGYERKDGTIEIFNLLNDILSERSKGSKL